MVEVLKKSLAPFSLCCHCYTAALPLTAVAVAAAAAFSKYRWCLTGGRENRNFGRREREREVVRMRVTSKKVAAVKKVPFLFTLFLLSPYSIPSFFGRPGSS